MARVLTAGNGWKTIVAAVVAYEAVCVEEELLSRGMDRLLERHPVWPRVAVIVVALHLINFLPERFDPFAIAVHTSRRGGRTERWLAWGKHALRHRRVGLKSCA